MYWLKMYLIFIIICVIYHSCDTENSQDVNDENTSSTIDIGSLLWVTSDHSDLAVKQAVGYTLDNSNIIIAQVIWSPFDSSFFDDIKWYHKLAIDHNKKFMLNLDWQNLNRNGTNGNWSFDIEEVQIKFKEDVLELANT